MSTLKKVILVVIFILFFWSSLPFAYGGNGNVDEFYKEEKYKKARSLMERILTVNPTSTTFFSCYEDSDSIRLLQYHEIFDFTPVNKNVSQFSLGRGIFKDPSVNTVYEDAYSLGTIFSEHKKNYKVSYMYRDFREAKDAHNYALEYKGPLIFIDNIKLKHGYESVATARAVSTGVKYFVNSFTLNQALPLNFASTFWYQFNKYNDKNTRHSGMTGLFYGLFKKPNIEIGYEVHYKDSGFSSPAYSTPDSLKIQQTKIKLCDNVWNSKFYYELSYGLGYASEKGVADKGVGAAEIYTKYRINDSLEYYVYYDFFKDTSYDGQTIQGAIKFRI